MIFFQAIYFFLPAYMANMAPVFAQKIPLLDIPLDQGKMWKGKRIFGEHKTVRGFLAGILLGIITAYWQSFYPLFSMEIITYQHWLLLGISQGFGAMLGDAIKSFLKRRRNISPGQSWIPYDQLDFIVGAIVLTAFFFPIRLQIIAVALAVTPFLHAGANSIGHSLGLRTSGKI